MEAKPLALVGGGTWGCLLAYALKKFQPEVKFHLYVESPKLGDGLSVHFRAEETGRHLNWLKPLANHSWNEHTVKTWGQLKSIASSLHLIEPEQWHQTFSEELRDHILHVPNPDLERLLEQSCYVIDTRTNYYFRPFGFHKTQELEIRTEPHARLPLSFEVSAKGPGLFQIFPVASDRLIVREQRFAEEARLAAEDFEDSILYYVKEKKITLLESLRKSSLVHRLPDLGHVPWNQGRLIRLNHFIHPVTGNTLPAAARIVSELAHSSLRLGEVKAILSRHRFEEKMKSSLNHKLCRSLSTPSGKMVLHQVHRSPHCQRKFYRGDLQARDLSLSLLDVGWVKALLPRRFQGLKLGLNELSLN